jgi:hypothetical protein
MLADFPVLKISWTCSSFFKKKHQIWKMCIAVPLTNERCENDGQTEVQNEHYLTESTKNRQMGGGRSGNHLGFRG